MSHSSLPQPTLIVTQFDLTRFVSLKNQIDALKKEQGELEQQLTTALTKQAHIEPGTYTARLKTYDRRSVPWKNVVIRLQGEAYAKRVLSATKPTAITKLVVS